MSTSFRQSIHDLLAALPRQRLDALKKLFWSELNYDRSNMLLPVANFSPKLKEKLNGAPLLFATAGDGDGFHIIYCHLNIERLSTGVERHIIGQLVPQHPYGLFLFSDKAQVHWHFVNVKYEREQGNSKRAQRVFRRLTIGPEERLRTATERIALLDTSTLSRDLFGLSPLILQQRHDEAFNVEAVTTTFFIEYKRNFDKLKQELERQSRDIQWAHEYALQFLNRMMFLYYVQRKRWLGNDPDFLRSLWNTYSDSDHKSDTFATDWLNVLFFEAFNNKFQSGRADRAHLPESIRNSLAMAPYLNGGLFAENKLDLEHKAFISDAQFKSIFGFLEQYNFTISEDTPLDQEVAVDPEMIGKVYESLVNVSEETDERDEAGIFYTPRVEIDLMCRLTLVDYLANHFGTERKSLLYKVVFAFEDEEKQSADEQITRENLWEELDSLLRNVTVLDPACGSGSFLVGMLYVLDDLRQRANARLGHEETAYERKKDIIRNSLYGVDVMRWAVHVAELRLWLQLVIDTIVAPAELKFRPLLPNLSFKIRHGDSLVQEIGGVNLAVRHGGIMPPALKGKLTDLKAEKRKFYNNNTDEPCKYQTDDEVRQAELILFREIVDTQSASLQNRIQELEHKLRPQTNLFGEMTESQMKLTQVADRAELETLQTDLEATRRAKTALRKTSEVPFVWDIAFVEVFEDKKGGFDVVVGNPPYVRREKIRDPMLPVKEASKPEAKKTYKSKLERSIYTRWAQTFGYDWSKGTSKWELHSCDLYVYFYFYSLSLLNKKGSFCFITSNSWLDAGYGSDLQEFLLTRGKVKWILDNQSRRSFASADVNTVIAMFGKPHDDKNASRSSQEYNARFVMLTVPFEYTLTPKIWQELEEANVRTTTIEYRLYVSRQDKLLSYGIDPKTSKFTGGKWGGKYLRAPDIYHKVAEKSGWRLLSSCCTVEGYIHDNNTGSQYPSVPFIKTIKLLDKILITPTTDGVIKYGVNAKGNSRVQAPILFARTFGSRHLVAYNPEGVFGKEFYKIIPNEGVSDISIAAQLNSTWGILQREILGLTNLGDGAIKFSGDDVSKFLVIDIKESEIKSVFKPMASRKIEDIPNELEKKDRKKLDDVIFDKINLSQNERDQIYEAVRVLVESRANKASSFDTRRVVNEVSKMEW